MNFLLRKEMELGERIRRGRRAISLAQNRGLDTAVWEQHLAGLIGLFVGQPTGWDWHTSWMRREWRRANIPEWRHILQESTAKGDEARADYADRILRDVLFDPECLDQ